MFWHAAGRSLGRNQLTGEGRDMQSDQYGNTLTTSSQGACDAYVMGLELLLAGQAGVTAQFQRATQEDPGFALGWAGLARAQQYEDAMPEAKASIAKAAALKSGLTEREASHINVFDLLLSGQVPQAYAAVRAHAEAWPRDAMVAQTSTSVFGLIGFSGVAGREAETLAFVAGLLPHYGEDWWMISQYAFALCETGNLAKADSVIDHALSLKADSAHGAHVRSHVSYEMGQTDVGRAYLASFMDGYDPGGVLHTHLNWHEALWALEQGDIDTMWAKVDAAVAPDSGSKSPAINVLTDTAAILHRATMAGVTVPQSRWRQVSDYAQVKFPRTGTAFVDVHAALAHAMAGRGEALEQIISTPAGPAGDLVQSYARAFRAVAAENWREAASLLTRSMIDLERMGGSRAQRDMIEHTLLTALVKQGKLDEARDIAALRRPLLAASLAA